MIFSYEALNWAFGKKLSNVLKIFEDARDSQTDLFKLEDILYLVEELKSSNCPNIQEKFADTTTWEKLCSLYSELFFANELRKLGFYVSLIPDNTPEWTIKKGKKEQSNTSPDIYVLKDELEFLIEVAQISDDETTSEIAESIRTVVNKSPFIIEIKYSKEFSIPVLNSQERTERKIIKKKFTDEFKNVIKTIDEKSLPQNRDIFGCKVTFSKPLYGKIGYYSGCVTDAVFIPEEKFKKQIIDIVEKKAKKRISWNENQRNKPYLVALDIRQSFILPITLTSLFFGDKCQFKSPLKSQEIEIIKVKQAKASGWKTLLEEVGFNEQISRIKDPGIFITNQYISENISGVIARTGGKIYCLPNPFAEESINCLDLQQKIPWTVT